MQSVPRTNSFNGKAKKYLSQDFHEQTQARRTSRMKWSEILQLALKLENRLGTHRRTMIGPFYRIVNFE